MIRHKDSATVAICENKQCHFLHQNVKRVSGAHFPDILSRQHGHLRIMMKRWRAVYNNTRLYKSLRPLYIFCLFNLCPINVLMVGQN